MVGRTMRVALATLMVLGGLALAAQAASAATSYETYRGYDEPSTPKKLDKVGVLKVGPKKAKKVLILVPGTSGAAAYFYPLAKLIAKQTKGWQIWSIERRGTPLEDHSVFDQIKRGEASVEEMFDYYLGWLTDPSISEHFEFIPDDEVAFGREWGMKVAVEDMRPVVKDAARKGKRVVMGGHSLGGSIVTAYATWDFNGKPGAKHLDGLVYVDGGSGPDPSYTAEEAQQAVDDLATETPWLSFGGIPTPFTGLFNSVGAEAMLLEPMQPSVFHGWPLLPGDLVPPVRTTNRGAYGYALDADTSPGSLAAAQVNAGHLRKSGDPRDWVRAGELSSIKRVAKMFAGPKFEGLDGTAWYHPRRLSLDSGAVAAGNPNPAQGVLDVKATHGDDLGKMPIYAFGAALGGQRVVDSAQSLADQNGIPKRKLRLINKENTYTHVDPLSAQPKNAFVKNLKRFLKGQVE